MSNSSRRRKKSNALNKFFDKIFVISLYDKTERWNKVSDMFKKRSIQVERFVAIDGRCKDQGAKGCLDKIKTFEMSFGVTIPIKKGQKLIEIVPAASLLISTILILREMVKKKWKHILICEDDIEIKPNLLSKFEKGVKELGNTSWDLLYLGVGQEGGYQEISNQKSKETPFPSQLNEHYDFNIYVTDERDLRMPCDSCIPFSKHITRTTSQGGNWCYAYSLSGAKKMLKLINNTTNNHIDQLIQKYTESGRLVSYAFDPPLVMHEKGRNSSDIPWTW
jgi:GR25 family glycosyltransferase involved in LPS biosynthesis